MSTFAIVLAAGGGTRMRSLLPKPLHEVCGRPMILHVLHALGDLDAATIVVVVGHGAEQVVECVETHSPWTGRTRFAVQQAQRGTGDAAMTGLAALVGASDDDTVVVIPGDTPLLTSATISRLVADHQSHSNAATLLTTVMNDPTGYGRIVRGSDGTVTRIVEHKDADADQLRISEVNAGVYAFRHGPLTTALSRIEPNNSQSEYYLTDVVDQLVSIGLTVGAVVVDADETAGVNDRLQLASAEQVLRRRINDAWAQQGVSMTQPEVTRIDSDVRLGHDVTLLDGVVLEGRSTIGDGCIIGPRVRISDSVVGDGTSVQMSDIASSVIASNAVVGPHVFLDGDNSAANDQPTTAFYTGQP